MGSMGKSILIVCLMGSLIFEEAQSLTCSSQSFKNRAFPHCQDLPYHNAFLHWDYNPTNSSLSVAYLAPPPRAGGWVAWAVNPVRPGMVGGQAFIATLIKGTPSVRTYNLSSYSLILPSPALSFPFWDLAAEFSDDRFTIFTTVKVPAKATSLNQVWQAGPAVNPESGFPLPHELNSANMNSESELVFDKEGGDDSLAPRAHDGASVAPAPAAVQVNETTTVASPPVAVEANETTTVAPAPGGSDKAGVAGIRSNNLGFIVCLFVFIWGINCFKY